MRTLVLLALVAGTLPTSIPAQDAGTTILDVQTICRADKDCHVKVVMGEGANEKVVVTTFQANRVGPDLKFFKGEEYGSFDFPNAGLMYLDRAIVMDESGTMRAVLPDDPQKSVLTFTTTLSVDPHGHVTFFYGFLHEPSSPLVTRSYLWGYAPSTVKIIGAIGGPRSPSVSRQPAVPQVLKGGANLRFRFACDADNRCRFEVGVERGAMRGSAITHFPANRLGEDMKYFPAEKEGGTDLLTASALYYVDLDVIVSADGAMQTPESGDAAVDVETLTSTVALDARGHCTFFYGFVREADSSMVRRFCLWGYSPETLMVDGIGEGAGVAGGSRKKGGT